MTNHLDGRRQPALPGLLLVLVGLLLVACGPQPTAGGNASPVPTAGAQPEEAGSLLGTDWLLVSLRGQPLLAGSQITLKVEADQLGGFAGCNAYGAGSDSGAYSILPDGTLQIPMLASTAMACLEPEGIMDQEAAYLEALPQSTRYRLSGDRLELLDDGGQTILTFTRRAALSTDPAVLAGTTWRLVSLNGQPPAEGSHIDLAFYGEHRAAGHAGCRDYIAGYEGDEQGLSFYFTAMLGPVCLDTQSPDRTDDWLAQEGAYTDALSWTDGFRLEGSRLELVSQRGESLVFEPLMVEARPPLEGPTWVLVAFVQPNPQAELPDPLPLPTDVLSGTELTLEFREGNAMGSAGCNQFSAAYQLDGTALTVQAPAATRIFCEVPAGAMDQEQRYMDWLQAVTQAHVRGQQLWLEAPDGRALVYRAPGWE